MKIQNFRYYVDQIKERLKEEGINLDLFQNTANGIRDAPEYVRREIQRIQGEFIAKLYHHSFYQAKELVELGYPKKEIDIATNGADSQKEASINWIINNYWKLVELKKEKKELENEKKKENKK